ncbi:hypothetical protein WN51_13090 [Melipona quadrifasciata]|uniref:Uncharacterized protein n=1 Tax=Melipona quadrifasciata TaxID=166423 RepID=A0A0M9A1T9_9HYME|nr:hypothetical protein WN51_13090 [Melipona quadrifasciata]
MSTHKKKTRKLRGREISDSEDFVGRKVKIEGETWSIYTIYSNRE